MRAPKLLMVLSAMAAVVGVTATSATSDACGASISFSTRIDVPHPAKRPPMEMLLSAEKRIERGDSTAGATQVLMAYPQVTHATPDRATPNEARALRDISVAIVRSSGATGPMGASAWASAEQRADNLAWASRTLRQLSAKDASDVVLQSDLAESLAAVSATEDEGREMLEALAKDDLLATSYGYEALAKERGLAGDADAMNAALTRCKAMASDAKICRAEVTGTTGSLQTELSRARAHAAKGGLRATDGAGARAGAGAAAPARVV